MKTLITLAIISLSLFTSAQQRVDEYKDYKVCTECLQANNTSDAELDKWKKSGLGNYGIPPQTKAKSYVSQRVKGVAGVVIGIFVVAITYSLYNQVNKTTSAIH